MLCEEVDEYLAGLDEPKRSTLEQVRRTILELLPDAEECISYRLPAYRIDGKVVAGFAAFKNHLAYLPHSGSVFKALADDLASFEYTTGSLHFPTDQALPRDLVAKLIEVRRALR
ncbi:MAG TPA: DUF1801 domain-containing protein [Mycobacteriales bacterium]|jgi:uncharacterized protein YdhG (YjbR/CyaY superfamily)|nr:DUF1801 domain-containing protein [Mycobacteriales bacterium]